MQATRKKLFKLIAVLLSITYIIAGCGFSKKETRQTKQNKTEEIETYRVRKADEEINPYKYLYKTKELAALCNILQAEKDTFQNKSITIKNTDSKIPVFHKENRDFFYEFKQTSEQSNNYISLWGYHLGDEINYYMDSIFQKHHLKVIKDGRMDKIRFVHYVGYTDDRIIHLDITGNKHNPNTAQSIRIYTETNRKNEKKLLKEQLLTLYTQYQEKITHISDKDNTSIELEYIGSRLFPVMITWSGKQPSDVCIYYRNSSGKVKSVKATDSIFFNTDGRMELLNITPEENLIDFCQLQNGKVITNAQLCCKKEDEQAVLYTIDNEKTTEQLFLNKKNELKKDLENFRGHHSDAKSYGAFTCEDAQYHLGKFSEALY